MNMDQVIDSFCRGDHDAAISKGRRGSLPQVWAQQSVLPGDNQAVGIGGKAKVLGKVEMPSGMGGVNGPASDASVSAQTSWCRDRLQQAMDLKKIETTIFESLAERPCGSQAD